MADKWNPDDDSESGRADEEVRGVANTDDEDEFEDSDEELEEEEDEESTTF